MSDIDYKNTPTQYIVKIREKAPRTNEYQENGYNRTFVAKTLDDAVTWLSDQSEGADSRYFDYTIEEVAVVQ